MTGVGAFSKKALRGAYQRVRRVRVFFASVEPARKLTKMKLFKTDSRSDKVPFCDKEQIIGRICNTVKGVLVRANKDGDDAFVEILTRRSKNVHLTNSSEIPEEELRLYATVGAKFILNDIWKRDDWNREMESKLGINSSIHLDLIWGASQAHRYEMESNQVEPLDPLIREQVRDIVFPLPESITSDERAEIIANRKKLFAEIAHANELRDELESKKDLENQQIQNETRQHNALSADDQLPIPTDIKNLAKNVLANQGFSDPSVEQVESFAIEIWTKLQSDKQNALARIKERLANGSLF